MTYDLKPAAEQVAAIASRIRDDQLDDPTPTPDWPVGALLDHVLGLASAFTDGARKVPRTDTPEPAARPPAGWRDELNLRLDGLVEAWRDPAAWAGEATVGGVTLPAELTAAVVTDELIVHGWDLAVATGQPYEPDPELVAAATTFAEQFAGMEGGPFGPPLPAPPDATPLQRLLTLTGRDPAWTP